MKFSHIFLLALLFATAFSDCTGDHECDNPGGECERENELTGEMMTLECQEVEDGCNMCDGCHSDADCGGGVCEGTEGGDVGTCVTDRRMLGEDEDCTLEDECEVVGDACTRDGMTGECSDDHDCANTCMELCSTTADCTEGVCENDWCVTDRRNLGEVDLVTDDSEERDDCEMSDDEQCLKTGCPSGECMEDENTCWVCKSCPSEVTCDEGQSCQNGVCENSERRMLEDDDCTEGHECEEVGAECETPQGVVGECSDETACRQCRVQCGTGLVSCASGEMCEDGWCVADRRRRRV